MPDLSVEVGSEMTKKKNKKSKRPAWQVYYQENRKRAKSGVYGIYCATTKQIYVGSSTNIIARWKVHRNDLREKQHHNKNLQELWDKFGKNTFSFIVLQECENNKLFFYEHLWWKKFGDCLNIKDPIQLLEAEQKTSVIKQLSAESATAEAEIQKKIEEEGFEDYLRQCQVCKKTSIISTKKENSISQNVKSEKQKNKESKKEKLKEEELQRRLKQVEMQKEIEQKRKLRLEQYKPVRIIGGRNKEGIKNG